MNSEIRPAKMEIVRQRLILNFFIYICILNLLKVKLTKTTLGKLEELFKQNSYHIRYEKGHFQSGFCLVHEKKVVIINKFFDTKARIECLMDILPILELESWDMDEKQHKFYQQVLAETAQLELRNS